MGGQIVGLVVCPDLSVQLLSLQAGWRAIVADMKLVVGDQVELQPDGEHVCPNGTAAPRLQLSIVRGPGQQRRRQRQRR